MKYQNVSTALKSSGFTLIELLVVISIIALLSSIVLSSLNTVRAKARDAKAKSELSQFRLAISFYYDKFGTMPLPISVPIASLGPAFDDVATQLVALGFLGTVPVAPANHAYEYYNYGAGTTPGVLIVTRLESATPTFLPYPGTCRPFSGGTNWCDTGALTTYYCLCNTF